MPPMEGPKHSCARGFIRSRLFDGLTSFKELEDRIAALPAEQERGGAFEVFAEAYLATQPTQQARQVWPFAALPPSLKQRLGLGRGRDMGVDGVFETRLGRFNAYQVKFRTGRTSLTWQELSTFMGLSDQVSERVLFTNSDDLPAVMNQRHDFYCIRGSDLDKLEPRDFEAIWAWLQGAAVSREKKQPQQHQQEALDHILPALEKNDRATAIMACGTGKTLVALWAAERLNNVGAASAPRPAANILVLVPSLALLRQTLHEWLRETQWQNFSYLCVCSDPTVKTGADEIVVRQSDLDFPVTTDAEVVRRFLLEGAAPAAPPVKITFSTYQSAREVANGLPHGLAFDLAIFDEAHKTAGREGRNFSFALDDKNLPIKKRLFLTATPRHYDVRKRDKEGDAKLVYSMDVPEVYGPVAHTLTFAEAARRGIICNYKVIISIVTSDTVNDQLLRHGKVLVKGDEIHARQVANQLALKAAVEKHGVGKIFTFHRSVASAKSFVSPVVAAVGDRGTASGEGIGNHLPDFACFHVNGTMSTAEREGYMDEFRAAPKAVMSNARCLTEGVDVPAVDMVAFLTPKRSKVDIVQATGRAMRLDRGNAAKTTGYILVPLFVEQAKGESVEDAVQRGEFDEVWNVLQAMQEQDDVLADIIRQMREERGRTKGFDDARFREKVEVLGPRLSLRALRDSITAACIDRLGVTWDERCGELEAFCKQFGHCNVPANWSANPRLAKWVHHQRRFRREGKLGENRIRRLDEIGLAWEPYDAYWEEMFTKLAEWRKSHSHCNVPQRWVKNPNLATWVAVQRQMKKKGVLSDDRIKRLDALGFTWRPVQERWEEMFSTLVEFKKANGHCAVPHDFKESPRLSNWVRKQRSLRKRKCLRTEYVRRLNGIGFVWDPSEAQWHERYSELVKYKDEHGDCNAPLGWSQNPKLANWVVVQRQFRKKGQLSKERIRRLDKLGFVWDRYEAMWEEMFSKLLEYRKANGDCSVPQDWRKDRRLGSWVTTVRQRAKLGRLTKAHLRGLTAIGFIWEPRAAKWEQMLSELTRYKKLHRDCNVPQAWGRNPKLGRWVSMQRWLRAKGELSRERIRRLDRLGFQWAAVDKKGKP